MAPERSYALPSPPVDSLSRARSEEKIGNALITASSFVTALAAVGWAWIQRGAAASAVASAVIAVFILAAASSPMIRLRRIGRALALSLALLWLAGFYLEEGHGAETLARLERLPRALLTCSVFVALVPHALRWLAARSRWSAVGGPVALAASVAVAADLYFVAERTTARFERRQFHPWLTYDDRGTYAYAHARERRVRDFRGVEFAQHKPAGTTRIVLDGASTMWGHYQDDANAPARRLQEYLQAASGRTFEVITVARPGKLQLNELIDAAATLPHWQPDLVVSWNGFNEIFYAEQEGRYEGEPYIGAQYEASLEASAFEAWLYRYTFLGTRLWEHAVLAREGRHRIRDRDDYEPARYYAYLRRTAHLLRIEGIRYAYSFCPNVIEKVSRSPEEVKLEKTEDAVSAPEIRERRRRSAKIVRSEGQNVYDAMEPLQGTPETFFLDNCHLNQIGVDRSMNDLSRRVLAWLEQPTPSTTPSPTDREGGPH